MAKIGTHRMQFLIGLSLVLNFICFTSNAQETTDASIYKRRIVVEEEKTYYVVGPRAAHLYMISRDVYGNENRWKEIAELNSIQPPYELTIGQKILIKDP